MKALILAAGFGTRLKPYSEILPKPLFPIAGRPNLDIIIERLEKSGCDSIYINTHHLHEKIEKFLSSKKYSIRVNTIYEPEILGTGGAIKNLSWFWDNRPFFVINSDIVTDIDFKIVYDFHLVHPYPVTLVVYDDPQLNKVRIDKNGFVIDFSSQKPESENDKILTFTGIQVLDPVVLDYIPDNCFHNSIDAYKKIMQNGIKICAFKPVGFYWKDVGTPKRYKEVVFDELAPSAFKKAFDDDSFLIERCQLKGDGSDRTWHRLRTPKNSLIMADHGIRQKDAISEIDAFISIGDHLFKKNLPVPKIHLFDPVSGLVFLEDLGDESLESLILRNSNKAKINEIYKEIIDQIILLSIEGAKDFDTDWTYQTPYYDESLILEKECRYFMDAFLNGYLGMNVLYDDYKEEFGAIAQSALRFPSYGFMHRDMQSRNIMVKNGKYFFIDFQGGRIGPIQYDLASLLIDPYVNLPFSWRDYLVYYCYDRLSDYISISKEEFFLSYNFLSIARNLQILGAYGFLSRKKGKIFFEQFIPPSVETLRHNLLKIKDPDLPELKALVDNILL